MTLALREINLCNALLLKRMAQHDARCNLRHRNTSRLGNKRHRPGRTWIHLNHINILIAVHNELDIKQSDDANLLAKLDSIGNNLLLNLVAKAE